MKRLFIRFVNSIILGYVAFKNPQSLLSMDNFKMLTDLCAFLMKVAEEKRPYITKIATISPLEETLEMVVIWAGAGIGAEPFERIEQLAKENQMLKSEIKRLEKQDN
jgi:hypothetical protein